MTFSKGVGRLATVLIVSVLATQALAQSVVRAGARVGTVQDVAHYEGYITISGNNYRYDSEVIKVYLDEEEVDPGILDRGIVVRFTLNAEGVVEYVDLLGPAAQIDAYFEH